MRTALHKNRYALSLVAVAGVFSFLSPAAAANTSCDRECQIGMLDLALTAFSKRQANLLPLAKDVRYTENGQVLALDDGFWATANGIGSYRNYFTDPVSGNSAFIGTMTENDKLVIFTLRIKANAARKITEIETIVSRADNSGGMGAQGPTSLEALKQPNPIWREPIAPADRMSRDDLIAVANAYFTGLQLNDGKGYYPFTDDCYRLENGMQSSGPSPISYSNPEPRAADAQPAGPPSNWASYGCKAQFELGWMSFVDRIRERRFLTVDPEYGTVFATAFFDHSGTINDFEMANGDRVVGAGLKEPYTWEIGEAFRIEGGKIRLIEATLNRAPYGMGSNWPEQSPYSNGTEGGY